MKCTLLIDHATEQLAFTACVFKDCNIDKLQPDEERGLYVMDNFFDRPLTERWAEFEIRLTQALGGAEGEGEMTGHRMSRLDELLPWNWQPISAKT